MSALFAEMLDKAHILFPNKMCGLPQKRTHIAQEMVVKTFPKSLFKYDKFKYAGLAIIMDQPDS